MRPRGVRSSLRRSQSTKMLRSGGDRRNPYDHLPDAPEKMGAIEEILCGKSGTITTANTKVAVMKIQGMDVNNTRKDTLLNCKLTPETLDLVKQSILYNTEARVEMDDTTYVPVANSTEVSLLKFLQDAEIPVHLLI